MIFKIVGGMFIAIGLLMPWFVVDAIRTMADTKKKSLGMGLAWFATGYMFVVVFSGFTLGCLAWAFYLWNLK